MVSINGTYNARLCGLLRQHTGYFTVDGIVAIYGYKEVRVGFQVHASESPS